jgi:hypothetical protein
MPPMQQAPNLSIGDFLRLASLASVVRSWHTLGAE